MKLAFERGRLDAQLLRQSEKRKVTRARRQRLHFPASRAKVRAGDCSSAIPATGDRYTLGLRILGSYDTHGSGLVRARPRGTKSAIGKERNASDQSETLNAYRPPPT